jgi:isopentenyl-diphosphate Delta-isomerase
MAEELILVDERNRAIGRAEKWAVHREARLHRAFSIFLVDAEGRLLLQQRSPAKYHSGGLWANSCCGHPRPGERTLAAARRRLGEELGAQATLRFGFRARYRTELPNGLTENEIVYVYFGAAPRALTPNPDEVAAVGWMGVDELKADIDRRPKRYAYWLRYYLKNHFTALRREARAFLLARDARRGRLRASPKPTDAPLA